MAEKKILSLKEKKEYAESLYKQDELTQKQIAERAGVSENTVGKWVKEGGWETRKITLLATKSESLFNLYAMLAKIDKALKECDDLDEMKKWGDSYFKYSLAIKNLETETSVGEIIEVARLFINDLQKKDPLFALQVGNEFDLFIKSRLKRF